MSSIAGGRRLPRIIMIMAALVLVVAVVITWNLSSPAYDHRVDAIRRKGYPVTLAELDAAYQRPADAENAAFLYTNAFAKPLFGSNVAETYTASSWLPSRGKQVDPEDRNEFEALLATNRPAMDLLYSAVDLPSCRFPVDLKQGAFTMLPHLAKVKSAAGILSTHALIKAEEGERDEAVRAFRAAWKVAGSLSEEPLFISQLVHYSSDAVVCLRLERMLNTTTLSDKELAELQQSVTQAEKPRSLALGLIGERATSLAVFTDPKFQSSIFSGQWGNPTQNQRLSSQFAIGLLKASGAFSKDKAFLLDTLSNSIWAAELPYPERWSQTQALPSAIPSSRFCIFSRILLPALSKAVTRDAEHSARIHVAQTALAVERFRLAHTNDLPGTLDDLAPTFLTAVPSDPFDGSSLRYKKLSKGYVVYSIGADGKDDGGKERASSTSATGSDITFIVER